MMNSWKINYPNDYNHLIDMADNPYNLTTQIRQIILGTHLFRGDLLLQDIATRYLERLHLNSFNNIMKFNQSYITLVANTARSILGP